MYRVHKWAGIIALGFAIAHWFTKEIIGDILKSTIGKAGKVPKDDFTEFLKCFVMLPKTLAVGILCVYRHGGFGFVEAFSLSPVAVAYKAMPVIYIALVFHGVFCAALSLGSAAGLVLAIVMSVGLYASVIALLGRIGMSNRNFGRILEVQNPALPWLV